MAGIVPEANIRATLTSYLAATPDDDAKDHGVKLGEEVVAKMLALRARRRVDDKGMSVLSSPRFMALVSFA